MDYVLDSLRNAFEDEMYKRSRDQYSIYMMLLATSLDRKFLVEYLDAFYELHALTGDRCLVIGPKFKVPDRHAGRSQVVWGSALRGIFSTITGIDTRRGDRDMSVEATDAFLSFLHQQTRDTYDIMRMLAIENLQLPAVLFFESLDHPSAMLKWELGDVSGREFVRRLRYLLQDMAERCHWNLDNEIRRRNGEVHAIEHGNVGSNQRIAKVRKRLDDAVAVDAYYSALAEVNVQLGLAKALPVNYPIDRLQMLVEQVSSGPPDRQTVDQLSKFGSKWLSRLPAGMKSAIKTLGYRSQTMSGDRLTTSWEHAKAAIRELSESARALELEKQKEVAEAKAGLEQLLEKQRTPPMSPLSVLRQDLRWGGSEAGMEHRGLGPLGQSPDVKRVFISYSHDTQSHVDRVWNFAKQLRGDGVDCWMDQDTRNPDRGFPHWSERQVRFAEIVLVACSPGYRAKFDSENDVEGGLGVKYEAHFIRQELYDKGLRNDKFLPVTFSEDTDDVVPALLRPYPRFTIPGDYRRLLGRILSAGGGFNAAVLSEA